MSGTFQLNGELFPRDPQTKRWTRQRVATSSPGEGIFIDFWRLEMRFGTLDTIGESDFFMGKFLEGGLHDAVLPHPEDGSLQSFTGVAITDYQFSYGDTDQDAYALNPRLVLSAIPVQPLIQYQGAGSETVGGEGGVVYDVTSLSDDGSPGTFRHAIGQSGARIVNIKVNGYIDLEEALQIDEPFLTVNGDTSDGKGICFRRNRVTIRTHDVIFRHLRFRVGDVLSDNPTQPQIDAMDSLQITKTNSVTGGYNIIIDHCTISWGIDENMQAYNTDIPWLENITIQWCLFADPLRNSLHTEQGRAKNLLNAPEDKVRNTSIHHCLLVDAKDRNPQITGTTGYDVVSNVLFNIYGSGKIGCGDNDNSSGAINVNVKGNLEIEGPDTNVSGLVLVRLENLCAAEGTDLLHQIYLADDNQDKDGDTGWALLTACAPGDSNIPADSRFEVGTPFADTGEPITVEIVNNLIDILVNGTGYAHAGVGACPGGKSGRDARDSAVLAELIVARDSGAGAVDTDVIKPVDTPSDVGGYPALA